MDTQELWKDTAFVVMHSNQYNCTLADLDLNI